MSARAEQPSKPLPHPLDVTKVKIVYHQGLKVSVWGDDTIEKRIQGIKDFKFKEGDVLLCVYPRSGTHWLLRIVQMVLNGKAEYLDGHTFDQVLLDVQPLHLLDNLDPPRVIATHYPFHFLPDEVKTGHIKIVHGYRNPKASLVSQYFLYNSNPTLPACTMESLCEDFLQKKVYYGSWMDHTESVLEYKRKHPNVPVLHVCYEDLKENIAEEIKKLAHYLDKDMSEELCQQIVTAVSFNNQKQTEEAEYAERISTSFSGTYRKGEIDDWKNHLTVAQSERIDAELRKRAAASPIFARYLTAGM